MTSRPLQTLQSGGGGTPHVLQTAHAGVAKGGGAYLYVHIYIYTYVQMTFMQVLLDRRSKGQGQNYTPPPPGVELRPVEPSELCSSAPKLASNAAAVRRWGGVLLVVVS